MNDIYRLVPLSALMKLDATKELPTRLTLLKWGRNETTKGPVMVGQKTLSVLPRNQALNGFDTVALDFEHNTVPGSPEYLRSQEPRPIGAKGKPFVELNVGLGIDNPRWTPDGSKFAGEGHYEDLSGAVALDENNEVIFLHSGALCRQGSARDIHLFSAGIGADGKLVTLAAAVKKEADGEHPCSHYLVAENPDEPSTWHLRVKGSDGKPDHTLMGAAWAALHEGYRGNQYDGPKKTDALDKLKSLYKSENMPVPGETQTHNPMNKNFLIQLFNAAGAALKPDASDADVDAAGAAFIRRFTALIKGGGASTAAPVDLAPLNARLDGFKTGLDTLNARFETLDREAIVRDASIEGKVVPASALPDKDGKGGYTIPQLRALVAELPVTVPVSQRTPTNLKTLAASSMSVSPESQAISNQLGITEEERAKWGGQGTAAKK